ncbi:MAG TPA: hypothetical protein VNA68_02025 [Candidatus Dormibacteraeota bacterium]|nr:hypothetical protein [Candidatus Dormibacteraeota bacterium]
MTLLSDQQPEASSTMIECPGCGHKMSEGDLKGQKNHMEQNHPEIITQRLTNAGFEQQEGKWVDTLAGEG